MFVQEIVDVGGRKVDLRRAGQGPPALYLHSAVGDFWGPEFLEPLTQHFEVICPAHPGFGESYGIEDVADIEDLAFHYSDLIDAIGAEKPHLIGLSFGGWIAAELAIRWPDRLKSLCLIDALGLWIEDKPIPSIWGIEPAELVSLLFEDQSHPLAQLLISIDLDDPPPDEILLQFISSQAATARVGWDPYLHDPKLESRLHRISCPTLVCWGERDRLVPIEYGRLYSEKIEGSRLETVPGGHLAALENPQDISRLLSQFLD